MSNILNVILQVLLALPGLISDILKLVNTVHPSNPNPVPTAMTAVKLAIRGNTQPLADMHDAAAKNKKA